MRYINATLYDATWGNIEPVYISVFDDQDALLAIPMLSCKPAPGWKLHALWGEEDGAITLRFK